MDTQKLRQRILDLAIRGKLVPQDPNDEPASVLLDRIRTEKERLIAEGKIKRPKAKKSTDKSHYQNFTPPFDIPESWEWVRLGDVCDVARGGSPRPIKSYLTDRVDGVNWIKIGDTEKDGKFINSTKEKIIPQGVSKSRLVHKGDFLLTNSMSFGRPYILNIDGCIHDGWLVISPIGNVFDKDFLYLLLSSEYAYSQFSEKASGSAVSNLNSDKVAESIFPLPPLDTQRRIVNEYGKLASFVQTIDNETNDLEKTIRLIKSRILDLAMQGRLMSQDPADEPAADMLRRINPKAKIITDNPHYPQLPDNWVLTRIKDVFEINPKNKASDNIQAGFVPMASIHDGYSNKFHYDVKQWGEIKSGFTHFADGDIAVAKISPCLENRKSMILRDLPNGIGAGTTELLIFRSTILIPEFSLLFFKSDNFIKCCTGTFNGVVGQQRVGKSIVEDIHIPIPPLNTQRAIVQRVQEWVKFLDNIIVNL